MSTSILQGPTILPLPLIQAQSLCFEKTAVMDLGRTARAALSGILAFVNACAPFKKIWPRRETLRVKARLFSEASLYRGLAELEHKGYIEREAQLHHQKNGRFHVSRINLTAKAIRLLQLDQKQLVHKQPSSKVRDGHIRNIVNYSSSYEESPVPQNLVKNLIQTESLDPTTRLPEPLVKLTRLGLTPKTICWLMRMARQKQKRLEDVVNFAWHYLQPLVAKGLRAIKAYLLALIFKDQDFAFQLRQAKTQHESEHQKEERRKQIRVMIDQRQGQTVHDQQQRPVGVIDGEFIHFFASAATGYVERWASLWGIRNIADLARSF